MHGNVWEWCQDWHGDYTAKSATDPTGLATGSRRVLRGGSWRDVASGCRSASRWNDDPSARFTGLGLRVVMVAR
ncbi:MAG: hypothetical protein FJ395_20355, partial [Verrucomicrobia bacterium]|nr:hypothetical protein [Verrucomicrobiota bacterium]